MRWIALLGLPSLAALVPPASGQGRQDGPFDIRHGVAVGMSARILRTLRAPTLDRCQDACAKSTSCQAFTYIRPTCWLKNGASGVRPWRGCISGVRRGGAPALVGRVASRVLADFAAQYKAPRPPPKPADPGDYSVGAANKVAASVSGTRMSLMLQPRDLARVLYVLEQEGDAKGLHATLKKQDPRYPDIQRKLALYHRMYDLPCKASRVGAGWPPEYRCPGQPKAPTSEPTPLLSLLAPMQVVPPPADPGTQDPEPAKESPAAAQRRRDVLAQRDKLVVPAENRPAPLEFCVNGQCFKTYPQVAAAIYGAWAASSSAPVFCAPRREGGTWSPSRVDCSSNWFDTLGNWKPWKPSGEPADAPEAGVIPPYACFGSPHLLKNHMVLPPGGEAGQGFHCRNRIFRVLALKAAKSEADVSANIASVCQEMRGQVWGEKYKDINEEYRTWCEGKYGKGSSRCPKAWPRGGAGSSPTPPQPFMLLSREELLFFFGHQELFCRADRPGLTHFLYNDKWADTFTCGIARGLLEAGPFEEGVQACALSPFVAEEPPGGLGPDAGALKARLHCWQHNRPTCEEVSRDPSPEEIYKRSVFDEFDALRELRRTRNAKALSLFDMKNAEKMQSYEDFVSYADTAKDEGTFGVKEFCRFVDGSLKNIRCGYTKQTMAQWYELRKGEAPEGCEQGVCVRGAFRRGYYCGLYASTELFCPDKNLKHCKPFWVCGLDVGRTGRKALGKGKAVCVGGARALGFHSPRGDKTSLQCYERRFVWGESMKSERILRAFDWGKIVEDAAKQAGGFYDEWLQGGPQAIRAIQQANPTNPLAILLVLGRMRKNAAEPTFKAHIQEDDKALIAWARQWGHSLGHRSTLGQVLMEHGRTSIPAVKAFASMAVRDWKWEGGFQTEALGCQEKNCNGVPLAFAPTDEGKQEKPRDENRAKEITELLHQVRYGGRPADQKWYRDFVRVVTEGAQLRVTTEELEVALRVHRLYAILDATREVLLANAKEYADAVFEAAAKAAPLSRVELMDRASSDPLDGRFKGTVFCVSQSGFVSGKEAKGESRYVCASSPFLVAGTLQRLVAGEADPVKRDKARNETSFGWCYGGIEGEMIYDRSGKAHGTLVLGSTPHFGVRLKGNPYYLSVPKGPGYWSWDDLEMRSKGARPQSRLDEPASPRRLQHLGRGPVPREATAPAPSLVSQVSAVRSVRAARSTRAASRVRPAGAIPALSGALARGPEIIGGYGVASSDYGYFNKTNWMSCAGLQYSDAAWQRAEAERPPAPAAAPQGAPPVSAPPALSVPPGAEKANDIMAKVQELGGPIISFVMQFFGHAPDMVKGIAHPSGGFLEEWTKKLTDIGKSIWDVAKNKIEDLQKQLGPVSGAVDKARELVDKARDAAHRAEVDAAKAVGKAKENAEEKLKEAKEAFEKAKGALQASLGELAAKTKDVSAGVKAVCKANQEIQGSGDLLNGMLEALSKLVMERLMKVLDPNVRHLITFGMRFLRGILGPVVAGVIGALASIPFVGGALAPIGEVAYDLAMNLLEDAAHRGLLGLIEKLLAQLLREVLTPVFKALQNSVLAGALKEFSSVLGSVCGGVVAALKFSALPPRDRWIDRALACSGRRAPLDWIYRDAAVARAQLLRTAKEMRTKVASYARYLADRYLARYGLSYDSWMAAVGRDAQPVLLARATEIERDLRKVAREMRARLRRGR